MIHLVFTLFPHSLANLWLLGRNLWTLFPRLYEVYFDFEVIVPLDMITVNTIQQKKSNVEIKKYITIRILIETQH